MSQFSFSLGPDVMIQFIHLCAPSTHASVYVSVGIASASKDFITYPRFNFQPIQIPPHDSLEASVPNLSYQHQIYY